MLVAFTTTPKQHETAGHTIYVNPAHVVKLVCCSEKTTRIWYVNSNHYELADVVMGNIEEVARRLKTK